MTRERNLLITLKISITTVQVFDLTQQVLIDVECLYVHWFTCNFKNNYNSIYIIIIIIIQSILVQQ